MTREASAVLAHPGLEFGDQWCCVFAAHREAVVYGRAAELALDIKDAVNAPDRLERQRREIDGFLAALERSSDVSEFKVRWSRKTGQGVKLFPL